jgi:hypothetical protein
MVKKQTTGQKKDLAQLSAWPRPSRSRPVGRLSEPDPSERPLPRKAIAHDLPARYHETYIRLIARDPHLLFSFWETARIPAGEPRLRLYETDSGTVVGDHPVERGARSRYIRAPEAGRRYRVEYGTGGRDRFMRLCSSNEVATPAGHMREPPPLTLSTMRNRDAAETLAGLSAEALPYPASPQNAAAGLTDASAAL